MSGYRESELRDAFAALQKDRDAWAARAEAAEKERDDAIARCEKWRTLAEGWKLTDDVRQHRVWGGDA